LIKKGSGAVVGLADLTNCIGPFDSIAWRAHADKHCIPEDQEELALRWNVAWVLENATPLTKPVRYEHPFGAVTWVNLTDEVSSQFRVASKLISLRHAERPSDLAPSQRAAGAAPIVRPNTQQTPLGTLVPVASDGTWFHSGLGRASGYTIGAKGDEVVVESYMAALAQLQLMSKARWRRPNPQGNWGIVTAVDWKSLAELEHNFRWS